MTTCLSEPVSEGSEPDGTNPTATLRVLHVINGEHYSGAERVQDLLAGELPRLGYQVGFACIKPDRFPRSRRATEAPLHETPMRGRFDPRPVCVLTRIVRREDYQIIHAHTPRTLLVAALVSLRTGAPLVYHLHSPTSRDSTRRVRNAVNALAERLGLPRASAVIAVSESLAEYARRLGVPEGRIHVVHNGVPGYEGECKGDIPIFADAKIGTVPAKMPGTWTLGTVALFRPRKGTEVLLDALAKLRGEGLPVRLLAVGGFETPEYERAIESQVERLGLRDAIEWIGFTEDVNVELARMDVFVLPSLFGEGLPMVVLEAMAAGVPVVATRVEGIPETIRDGRDGLVVEPGDADALAQALARVVRGEIDVAPLRQSALARHAEHFSARRMAEGVAEVYDRVLTRRSGASGTRG
ncbi:MAG: glycosyltransferase [Pirellulales bacterium]|nr:glycosyltransferase [Pirellulales bacterium]